VVFLLASGWAAFRFLFVELLYCPRLHDSSQEREREPRRFPLLFAVSSLRLFSVAGLSHLCAAFRVLIR
jgi:hypothetical protein